MENVITENVQKCFTRIFSIDGAYQDTVVVSFTFRQRNDGNKTFDLTFMSVLRNYCKLYVCCITF